MAFYHLRSASFCFIVLTLVAFKDTTYVFGNPTNIKSGVCFGVQVFQCKKVHNDVIFNLYRLQTGESMASPDGRHLATLGNDGNFVVDGGRWKTNTGVKGVGPWFLILQQDGNLVIYDRLGDATWASGSRAVVFNQPPWRLNMQDDGNLVIYDSNDAAMWAIGI